MSASKDGDGGWKKFVWNSEKKEFLGRTGGSWLKIFIFYVIFYGCLAGIFIGTIQAMLMTLSNYKPTYQDRVAPPGLSHIPHAEKSEISYSISDEDTYRSYTKAMSSLMIAYEDKNQTGEQFEDCGDTAQTYKERGDMESDTGVRRACIFRRSWLKACSGMSDSTYGFKEGKPCLIVKLNRIVNFRPKPPKTSADLPGNNVTVNPFLIPIHCHSKKEDDADKVGKIEYFGIGGGFPLQYYPYYGKLLHPEYRQPLVGIQFANITLNQELRVECKVYGQNIDYSEKDRYQGRFDVKIMVRS